MLYYSDFTKENPEILSEEVKEFFAGRTIITSVHRLDDLFRAEMERLGIDYEVVKLYKQEASSPAAVAIKKYIPSLNGTIYSISTEDLALFRLLGKELDIIASDNEEEYCFIDYVF